MKCKLQPDSTNYDAISNAASVSVQLDGGASRFRKDQLGAAVVVDAQWSLGPDDYNWIMAFYRTGTDQGADAFTIDLVWDKADVATYTAHFVPGTFSLASQIGLTYVVKAQLEIIPLPVDTDADNTILAS